MFIGAGKVDTVATKFTGIMGYASGGSSYLNGGGQVMSALTGMGFAGNSIYGSGNPYWCGSVASCAWTYGIGNYGPSGAVDAAALPILTYQKCYP